MRSAQKAKFSIIHNEDGATLILIAGLTVVFVAFTAMAVDIAHLYVVRNELHNAADAGALAGARCLYDCFSDGSRPGSRVNTDANDVAYRAAIANTSENVAVEVNWTDGQNTGSDVERGHWSFATRTFTPLNRTDAPDLWNISTQELDNPQPDVETSGYVNAVKVIARREQTQAASFFARILGFMGFNVSAEAVAYIGFAGQVNSWEVDQPVAICRQSIVRWVDGEEQYTCNVGRMTNSGTNIREHNTAAWSNFSQEPSCHQARDTEVVGFVCADGNPNPLIFGVPLGVTGGELKNAHKDLRDCFINRDDQTKPWNITLPVIDCGELSNPVNCKVPLVGVVNVNVLYLALEYDIDTTMPSSASNENKLSTEGFPELVSGFWTSDDPNCVSSPYPRSCQWNEFVADFNLLDVDDKPATYNKTSIYFLPDCEEHEPIGGSGGVNFGILARIPVLVD